MRGSGDIECIDGALASLARGESALRLRLGQLLEVLGRGAVFQLGFSSIGAYAVERCERSVRWAEAARCLARRAEVLPETRRAMALGKVSWAMGEVLARVATPADELRWLALAESRSVRQVRQLAEEAVSAVRAADVMRTSGRAVALEPPVGSRAAGEAGAGGHRTSSAVRSSGVTGDLADEDAGEPCTLTCTVNREDAWLFEATRALLDQLGERSTGAQVEAMLAEAQGALLDLLPRGAIDGNGTQYDAVQQRRVERLRRWQAEAEMSCEGRILGVLASKSRPSTSEAATSEAATSGAGARLTELLDAVVVAASLGLAHLEHHSGAMLDRQVRAVADALARHELELSALVLRFHRANGWRKLGYATEAQYARERLGLSRSSFVARRALALRLERLPGVAAALGAAHIGVEAALQLVRVATPSTEAAWIDRARRRTIKHLREEVAAARVAVRWAGEVDCPPPEAAELAAFHALEQAVVSGRLGNAMGGEPSEREETRPLVEPTTGPRKAWCVMLGSLASWLQGGLQMSAAVPVAGASRGCAHAGRVALRLCVSLEIGAWWRGLEARARRWLPRGMSWLRFVCLSVWHGWRHMLGTRAAYEHIYIRDRFRCTSPVCPRRDVTPHHIEFRSAGGSDEASNVTSPCTWCHLHGVHGGRIRASGTAEHIRWEFGPKGAPLLVVDGRERFRAGLRP